jgi:hypothetical protein
VSTNGTEKFEGVVTRLGDKEYIIPSLSTKQARRLWPLIMEINEGVSVQNLPEKYEKILQIIHAAISRNYPEVTVEELDDLVDLSNVRKLQMIVIGQSGLTTAPGPQPVAPNVSVVSTGLTSTVPS